MTRIRYKYFGLYTANAAMVLVVAGGLYDLLVPSVPTFQLEFLGVSQSELNPNFLQLHIAVFRALGGCLLAIGVCGLILINGPIREGQRLPGLAVLVMVGLGEGINAIQMYKVGSPFWVPLVFIGLLTLGLVIWYNGRVDVSG